MEKIAKSHNPDRDLYLLELGSPDGPGLTSPLLAGAKFICFVVGDFRNYSQEQITEFGAMCIEAGAVHFCTWGPDCSRVHDCIDLARDPDETDDTLIPTSWHENDALYEALYFATFNAFPSDAFFNDCNALITLVVNNPAWSSEIRRWMSDPEALRERVISEFEP